MRLEPALHRYTRLSVGAACRHEHDSQPVSIGKTAPKGSAIFIADCLARDSYLLTTHNGLDTTAELLGLDNAQAVAKLVADLATNGDGRAQVITLALVLGALESRPQGRLAQCDT